MPPSSANRPSDCDSLKIGLGERGSQRMRLPVESAVTIRFPGLDADGKI